MDLAPGETAGGSGGALCLLQMHFHSTQQAQLQGQKALQDVQEVLSTGTCKQQLGQLFMGALCLVRMRSQRE